MAQDDDDSSDGVGYGRPPKATRFKKGNTFGSRKRKPRRSRRSAFDSVEDVLNHRVPLTIEGITQRVTIAEAMLLKLRELALSGNRRAITKEKKLQQAMPAGPEEHAATMEKVERTRLGLQLKLARLAPKTSPEDEPAKKEAGNEGSRR